VRPVSNVTEAVTVHLKLKLSQLIAVVGVHLKLKLSQLIGVQSVHSKLKTALSIAFIVQCTTQAESVSTHSCNKA
jgi:hypothetical protein